MSSATERRRAGRLACRLPVRLLRGGHVVLGETEDLSLLGMRIRLPHAALQLPPEAHLGEVAQRIHERLGEAFIAELAWPTLGSLVRRVLRITRLARPPSEGSTSGSSTPRDSEVELGCELRVPLGAPEVHALGLPLPAASETPATAGDDEERQVVLARAILMPPRAPGQAPLKAHVRQIRSEEIVLALPRPERLGVPREHFDVTALMVAFHQRFGSDPHLLVLGLDEPLWAGNARVTSFEWLRANDLLRVTLRPAQPLANEELARLGVCVGVG